MRIECRRSNGQQKQKFRILRRLTQRRSLKLSTESLQEKGADADRRRGFRRGAGREEVQGRNLPWEEQETGELINSTTNKLNPPFYLNIIFLIQRYYHKTN